MWKQWNNILFPLKEQTSVVFKAILWQKYLKYRHKLYNSSCFPTCVLFHCTKGETFLSEARGEKLMNALTSFERSAPRSTISVGSLSLLKEWSWSWGGDVCDREKGTGGGICRPDSGSVTSASKNVCVELREYVWNQRENGEWEGAPTLLLLPRTKENTNVCSSCYSCWLFVSLTLN